jgi:enoyl-CoA hydratase/carnithine racemase
MRLLQNWKPMSRSRWWFSTAPSKVFFLTHYNFLAKTDDSANLRPGLTGLQPLPDMLVRLSRAPVVSIVSIRGRATGGVSDQSPASDMRFASREKAILSQWEVGAGLVPGGGPMARLPRLIGRGRALEVQLTKKRNRT